jgi:hypothetical protein
MVALKERSVKVKIKSFGIDMEVKNKGVELDVYTPGGQYRGDVKVTKTGLTGVTAKSKMVASARGTNSLIG